MYQHFGFLDSLSCNGPWAIFSTVSTTTSLYARSSGTDTLIPGNYLNAPHHYRIEWTTSAVKFYIDGGLVAAHNTTISNPMIVMASDFNLNATALSVDWLRMSPPYASFCTFESRVLDAEQLVDWLELTYAGSTPTGTTVSFETRTGNTATPDAGWSVWQAVNSPISSPVSPARL